MNNKYYENKYLKYKQKYFELKYNMFGGNVPEPTIEYAQILLNHAKYAENAVAIELATQYLNILKFIDKLKLQTKEGRHIDPESLQKFRADIEAAATAAARAVEEAGDRTYISLFAMTLDEGVNYANNIVSQIQKNPSPPPSAFARAYTAFELALKEIE